jgi:hypothetical protein
MRRSEFEKRTSAPYPRNSFARTIQNDMSPSNTSIPLSETPEIAKINETYNDKVMKGYVYTEFWKSGGPPLKLD